jgi:hypothetical protein
VSAPHLDGKLPDTVVHALGAAIQQARARQTP